MKHKNGIISLERAQKKAQENRVKKHNADLFQTDPHITHTQPLASIKRITFNAFEFPISFLPYPDNIS
jgi:hypothetical protein